MSFLYVEVCDILQDEYGIIYCALNIVNNKRYIGQTIRGLERRKREHIWQSEKDSEFTFHKALRKYGKDKFEWSIIDVASNAEELDEKEIYWINKYDTYHYGYNMSTGGQFNQRTENNADDLSARYGGREFYVFDTDGNYIKSVISQSQFASDIGVGITTVNNVLLGIKNSTKGYVLIFKDKYSDEVLRNKLNKIYEWHKPFVVFDKNNRYIGTWDNKTRCSK